MKEETEEPAEFAAWINTEKRIVTFREAEGYEKLAFQTQDEKLAYIYRLCESGYRIL